MSTAMRENIQPAIKLISISNFGNKSDCICANMFFPFYFQFNRSQFKYVANLQSFKPVPNKARQLSTLRSKSYGISASLVGDEFLFLHKKRIRELLGASFQNFYGSAAGMNQRICPNKFGSRLLLFKIKTVHMIFRHHLVYMNCNWYSSVNNIS